MELKRWVPLLDLESEMRSMFDRYWPAEERERLLPNKLVADMHRDEGDLVVTVELPGVDPDKDVDITVEDDILIIKGEKSDEREVEEEDHFLRERRFGNFERRIFLPDGVDPDAITASYDHGVLTVRVPIPVEAEGTPRRIPIKANP
ncbi:MAG TPA: Hsp20/alpha crystallin family protein [Acidimicrobiia bacterium]|nr:Hsp20/alpha crystallin family protein [Acidimicrobiia bacterium]